MVPFTMLMVRAFSETPQMLPYAKDLESLTSKLNIAKSKESLQNAKARIDPSIPDINFLGMLSMHSQGVYFIQCRFSSTKRYPKLRFQL